MVLMTCFLPNVEAVHAQEAYMDEKGRFFLDRAQPVVYSHGTYYALGKAVGSFGYSVKNRGLPEKK